MTPILEGYWVNKEEYKFKTETPLRSVLQQKNLRISDDFPCKIISTITDALKWLS